MADTRTPSRDWLLIWSFVGGFCIVGSLVLLKRLLIWLELRETHYKPVYLYHYFVFYVAVALHLTAEAMESIPDNARNPTTVQLGGALCLAVAFAVYPLEEPLAWRDALGCGLAIAGQLLGYYVPKKIHNSGFNLAAVSFAAALLIGFVFCFMMISFFQWTTYRRGLGSHRHAEPRRYLLFLYCSLWCLAALAGNLLLRVLIYEAAVEAMGNVVLSFFFAFGVLSLVKLYYFILALHDFDMIALAVVFASTRRLLELAEAGLFGSFGGNIWLGVIGPIAAMLCLVGALVLFWLRDNFTPYHMVDTFADNPAVRLLFAVLGRTAKPPRDSTSAWASSEDEGEVPSSSGGSSAGAASASAASAGAAGRRGQATPQVREDEQQQSADSTGLVTSAEADEYYSYETAEDAGGIGESSDLAASLAQAAARPASTDEAIAKRYLDTSSHSEGMVSLKVPRDWIASVHMPVTPGFWWTLPVLAETTKLPHRCDGVHVMRYYCGLRVRAVFACGYLSLISILYFATTLVLMAALYQTCAVRVRVPDTRPAGDFWSANGEIALNEIRLQGTHNSYHLAPLNVFPGFNVGTRFWQYTHATLTEQLESGVRFFELDLHARSKRLSVFHLNIWDDRSSCRCLHSCLSELRAWSERHPGHLPIFVMFEFNLLWFADLRHGLYGVAESELALLETMLRNVIGRSRIFTPDALRNGSATLTEAVRRNGWPSVNRMRDKFVFMLDSMDSVRKAYIGASSSLEGKLIFTLNKNDGATPHAEAIFKYNDPIGSAVQIGEAVRKGYLVRTRADSTDSRDQRALAQLLAARNSGAQLISFDFTPAQKWRDEISLNVAGCLPPTFSSVSRCNSTGLEPNWDAQGL